MESENPLLKLIRIDIENILKISNTGEAFPKLNINYSNELKIWLMTKIDFCSHIFDKGIKQLVEKLDKGLITLDELKAYELILKNATNQKKQLYNMIFPEFIKLIIDNYSKYKKTITITVEQQFREDLQQLYLDEIVKILKEDFKVFIKAPTGFGKTHLFYKTIKEMNFKKIIIFTPRLLLNRQMVEDKYIAKYINRDAFEISHFSDENKKQQLINKLSNTDNFIMTCCYQSANNLLSYMSKSKLTVDLIIFDEAHFITNDKWIESDLLTNPELTKYKIFASATPTEEIENNSLIYGKIIEKVKVYELINKELLCDIVTLVKKMNNKKLEYHNLKGLIVESMTKYKKKKGIVYVNNIVNAQNLYDLMNTQDKIKSYIYVSGEVKIANENDIKIEEFEKNVNPCIIIVVGKIGYGYDNDYIDFICLGDPRQSDIDIRQILGRGLRWNKMTYPNKLLHLLVPLYKNEFGNYSEYGHLKKYLDYIIGECGQDIIIKGDGTGEIVKEGNPNNEGKDYSGNEIPVEILQEYCTTGYNKFTDFMKFLKTNKIFGEVEYNELKDQQAWMPEIGLIHKKYPKFCFRNINPNNLKYYWNKSEAVQAKETANKKLIEIITFDRYKKLNEYNKMEKIKELGIDNKIPPINLNYYYPNDNILLNKN